MTANGENDAQKVINSIPEIEIILPADRENKYVTKSGVTLQLKRVPPLLLSDAQRNVLEPKVPRVANLDKDPDGSVDEENPSDPDYIEAMNKYRQTLSDLASAIYFTRGTEPVVLPEGMSHWEDSEWSADLEELTGLKIPAVGKRRYFCWLKYVVLDDINDFGDLLRAIMRMSGITMEADVAQAADSFRGDEARPASEGLHADESGGLGDTDQLVLAGDSN